MKRTLRIGTRASALATAQSGAICRQLAKRHKGYRFRLVEIRTHGDEFQSVEIFKKTNVGVFTKEIEKQLLDRRIDIAVHSLKDLPTDLPKDLVIGAYPKRESVEDALVSKERHTLASLPMGAVVGTGSPRRKRQLARLRPDLNLVDIRGNLDTRVRRAVHEGRYDAVVVAMAGLKRVNKFLRYARAIPADELLPAVGQAALAVEVRADDAEARRLVGTLNHAATETAVRAERVFLKALQGGCRVPVGVRTRLSRGKLRFSAAVFSTKEDDHVRGEVTVPAARAGQAAKQLAAKLLKAGARRFLKEARP